MRRTFETKKDKVIWEWGKVHNEKLYDLYSLTNIIPVIKSRNATGARHVALMERGEVHTWFWVGGPDGKIQLRRPKRRWEDNCKMVRGRDGLIWLRIGTGGGLL
jgi:hypothetical protein